MSHDELQALFDMPPDRSLVGLENKVWQRVAARVATDRKLLELATLQGGVLIAALLVSLSLGAIRAGNEARSTEIAAFSSRMTLAPSTRLIGAGG